MCVGKVHVYIQGVALVRFICMYRCCISKVHMYIQGVALVRFICIYRVLHW